MSEVSRASEHWLPVPGWEGYYEVSDQGRARSLDREIVSLPSSLRPDLRRRCRGQELKLTRRRTPKGRPARVTVRLNGDGRRKEFAVHRLVLSAFVGPCPAGMEGCHNNGNAFDNCLQNLRWDTTSENNLDRVRHGTHTQAAQTHCPWGHLYEDPNLVEGRKPDRVCRACARAASAKSKAKRLGLPFDYQSVADQKHADIMRGRSPRARAEGADHVGALAPDVIEQINVHLAGGESTRRVSAKTGVSRPVVRAIKAGRHWSCRRKDAKAVQDTDSVRALTGG